MASYLGSSILRDVITTHFGYRALRRERTTDRGRGFVYSADFCIGGQTVSQLIKRIRHARDLAPVVYVMIGVNDILRRRRYHTIKCEYRRLIKWLLRKDGVRHIILLSPIPTPRYNVRQMQVWRLLCDFVLRSSAHPSGMVRSFHAGSHFLVNGSVRRDLFRRDRLHPNRCGMALLRDILLDAGAAPLYE